MCHDTKHFCDDESFDSWDGQEKDLSTSLTVRWSRKHKRWESDNVAFWNDRKNKWSCRSEDGKYYYGFRSFRALLKSYVGGILCENARCCSMKHARAKYWFSQYPKQVTCTVTMRCTSLLPAALC